MFNRTFSIFIFLILSFNYKLCLSGSTVRIKIQGPGTHQILGDGFPLPNETRIYNSSFNSFRTDNEIQNTNTILDYEIIENFKLQNYLGK